MREKAGTPILLLSPLSLSWIDKETRSLQRGMGLPRATQQFLAEPDQGLREPGYQSNANSLCPL